MKILASWAPAPNLTVTAVEQAEPDWIVSIGGRAAVQDRDRASYPVCGTQSSSRHSSYSIYGRCAIFPLEEAGEYPGADDPLAMSERSVRSSDFRRAVS
jgi:hypothetical protein